MSHLIRVSLSLAVVLTLVVLSVPVAEASPPPEKYCWNVCGPGVPCSTGCGVYDFWVGGWLWVDCTTYDTQYGGGGSCGSAIGSTTGDLDLDRFLLSLECLAETERTNP